MFDHSSHLNIGEASQVNTQNYHDHSSRTIVIEGGHFPNQIDANGNLAHAGMRELRINIAEGAFHESDERRDSPSFHPETILAVREKIMGWISNQDKDGKIMWLSGPAGCGKTAIAGSVAEICKEQGVIAASFFASCSGSEKRSLIPTLAYSLTQHNGPLGLRERVLTSIGRDPSIFSKRLQEQCKALFLKPFSDAQMPSDQSFVMIIDGLEKVAESYGSQSGNGAVWTEILTALQSVVEDPAFRFRILIVSRPERDIQEFFASKLDKVSRRISLDNKYDPGSYKAFQDLKKEKEELEKSLPELQCSLRKKQQDADSLEEENQKLKKEQEELKKSLADLDSTLRRKRRDADNFKEENQKLKKAIQDLRDAVPTHHEAQTKAETAVGNLTQQLSNAQSQADQYKMESKRLRNELDTLEIKHRTVLGDRNKSIQDMGRLCETNKRLEKDANEQKEKNQGLRTKLSGKEKTQTMLTEKLTAYKTEFERRQGALGALEAEHRALLKEAGELKERNRDSRTALAAEQKAYSELEQDMKKLKEKYRKTRSRSGQYRNESEHLRKQLDALEAKYKGDMMAQVWWRADGDATMLSAGRRGRDGDRSRDSSHHSGRS